MCPQAGAGEVAHVGAVERYAPFVGVRNPRDLRVDGVGNLWVVGSGPDGRERLASYDGEQWTPHGMTEMKPDERIVFGAPDPRRGMWYVLKDLEADLYRLVRVDGSNIVDVPLPVAARRYWMPRIHADRAGRLWLFLRQAYGLPRNDMRLGSALRAGPRAAFLAITCAWVARFARNLGRPSSQ